MLFPLQEPEILQQYRQRPAMRIRWEACYSPTEMVIVQRLLHLFCESFGFWEHDENEKFKFLPEDKPFEIYRAIYPPKTLFQTDCMEIEALIIGLEKDFKISTAEDFLIHHLDVTLQELIDYVLMYQAKHRPNDTR